MYSALLALAGSATSVIVWTKGGGAIANGVTVDTTSTTSVLVLTNGTNKWTWEASDVGGFYA